MPKELTEHLKTTQGRVERIAGIIDEMKGEQIVVLDLHRICDFADTFIIATVRSSTHMQAVAANLMERLREEGLRPLAQPDQTSTRWTLLDFADVVVHLFDRESRAYYDLERLWADAESRVWESAVVNA